MSGTSNQLASALASQQLTSFGPASNQSGFPRQTSEPAAGSSFQAMQVSATPAAPIGTGKSSTSGLSFPSMDLSGKLIIKVQIEGDEDIRRIPIHNEDITYDELLLMMQRVFVGKVSSSDDVVVKYCDEDGDYITIMDNSDLTLAKQASRILHLRLYIQGRVFLRIGGCSCDVMAVREELIEIRDRVNRLLDLIVPDGASQQKASTSDSLRDAPHESSRPVDTAELSVAQKLFDPLKSQSTGTETDVPPVVSSQLLPPSAPAAAPVPATVPAQAAVDSTNTASAIADSFGLSADEMAPPPEQPNAPPSEAVASSFGTLPPTNSTHQPPMGRNPTAPGSFQQQPQPPAQTQATQPPMPQQPPTSFTPPVSSAYPAGNGSSSSSASSTPAGNYPNSSHPASTAGPAGSGPTYYAAASGGAPVSGGRPAPMPSAMPQPGGQPGYNSYQPAPGSYNYGSQAPQNPAGAPPSMPYGGKSPAPGGPPSTGAAQPNPYARSGYPGAYPSQSYRQPGPGYQ